MCHGVRGKGGGVIGGVTGGAGGVIGGTGGMTDWLGPVWPCGPPGRHRSSSGRAAEQLPDWGTTPPDAARSSGGCVACVVNTEKEAPAARSARMTGNVRNRQDTAIILPPPDTSRPNVQP